MKRTKTETGFETDGSGWSREWVFVFDNSGSFISGSETQNGVTTSFGAGGEVTGKSAGLVVGASRNSIYT